MSILKTIKISTCQNQQPLSILTLSKLALSTLLPDPVDVAFSREFRVAITECFQKKREIAAGVI